MSQSDDKTKSILSQWNALKKSQVASQAVVEVDDDGQSISEGQQRLYFLDRLHPNNPVYNLAELWTISGDFDPDVFFKALEIVGKKQASLRTTFHIEDNQLKAHIRDDFIYEREVVDLSKASDEAKHNEFHALAQRTARSVFDLAAGPLINVAVAKMSEGLSSILISMHHIISDKWSMKILRDELAQAYHSVNTNQHNGTIQPLEKQFADYALQTTKSEPSIEVLSFWKTKLLGASQQTTFPYDKHAHKNTSLAGKYAMQSLDEELNKAIRDFCKKEKITPFVFFLGVFKFLLYRYTHNRDILVGTPISTRTKPAYEKIIGFFNDTMVLRSSVDPKLSVTDYLSTLRNTVLEAFKHQEIGFQHVLNVVDVNRSTEENPLFQTMFLYHKEYEERRFTDELGIEVANYDIGVSKFDLTLYVGEASDGFELTIEYATDLYTPDFIERLFGQLNTVAKQFVSTADTPLAEVALTTAAELQKLMSMGRGPVVPVDPNSNIVQAIFQDVNLGQPALSDANKTITYGELDKRSNQIANAIIEHAENADIIGILLEQSTDFVVAMIGVLKAGKAYVPLDMSYPPNYLEHVLEKSKVEQVLISKNNTYTLPSAINSICLEDMVGVDDLPAVSITGDSPAYVIFTSGSTGDPNGVVVSHANLMNSTLARFTYYDDHPSSYLLLSSFSFDSSVAGIYWTLMHGGRLVILDKAAIQDVDVITEWIASAKVSHTLLIPSLYKVFLELIDTSILENLRTVILAGESLPVSLAKKHHQQLPSVRLYNEYGPTEATVWSSAYEVASQLEIERVPIGRPIANTSLFILDEDLNLTPHGIPGELFIGGRSVSQGYLQSPKSKKKKFIHTHIAGQDFQLYRTGDWVKWNSDNNLVFLGRRDHQVKVRGHRIELGEIDSIVLQYMPEVQSATVYIKNRNELVTCIVSPVAINQLELLNYLRATLPNHFCPDRIMQLEAFPLMANSKVDYKALTEQAIQVNAQPVARAELTSKQAKLLSIWREVLRVSELTIYDNFFESGGDSIQIIRIIAKLRKEEIRLSPKDIYNHQTVAELSRHIPEEIIKERTALIWDKLPVSPIQSWFFDLHRSNPNHWLQGYSFEMQRSVPIDLFKQAIESLVLEYEIFQLGFVSEYDKWFQVKRKIAVESFIKYNVSNNEFDKDIDLLDGPLAQFYLFGDNNAIVSGKIVMHHLITDAISWNVLFDFLETRLSGEKQDGVSSQPEYFHWINRVNQLASTNIFDESIPYWNSMCGKSSPFLSRGGNSKEAQVEIMHLTIEPAIAQSIRQESQRALNLKVDEIIIGAFLHVFCRRTQESGLTVMLERHGRTIEYEQFYLSNSIGWHTSYFPQYFAPTDPKALLGVLIDVKEQMRQIPHDGQSYGILKYISQKITAEAKASVVINYLGDREPASRKTFEKLTFLYDGMRSPSSERDFLIEINAWFENDALEIAFAYDSKLLPSEEMTQWSHAMIDVLESIPDELQSSGPLMTPSDMDFEFDQSDLHIINSYVQSVGLQITDVIELSATQSALLFHHLQGGGEDQGLIVATTNLVGPLDQERLQQAWNSIIERHDAMRSFFIWDGLTKPAQIICSSIESPIEFREQSSIADDITNTIANELRLHDPTDIVHLHKPPIHKLVCFLGEGNQHQLVFVCHHIYLDGWSTSNLFNEFIEIYASYFNKEPLHLPALPGLGQWKKKFNALKSSQAVVDFWKGYLANHSTSYLKPDSFSKSHQFETQSFVVDSRVAEDLEQRLREARITWNTFFVGLWSWLLSTYLDKQAVVMGLTHSGRSIEFDQMDAMIGMFSTVLPVACRDIEPQVVDFTRVQENLNDIFSKDAVSLEDLTTSELNQKQNLFDTLLIVENFVSKSTEDEAIYLTNFKSRISSTIPLAVVVVPDDELRLIFQYNSNAFSSDEIMDIGNDLLKLVGQVNINDGIVPADIVLDYTASNEIPEESEGSPMAISFDANEVGVEESLLNIWRTVLARSDIGLNDNYFDLGGTSILAVRIFNQINLSLGINASPILLLKHNTISKLAAHLVAGDTTDSWQCLYPLREGGHLDPLFCFHAGDGHILFYKEIAEAVRQERPVVGIQPVGLDGSEIEFSSIEEMADFYITEIKKQYPNGPYHLLGTCFSNAVTFEIAKRLKSEIGKIFIIDSPPPHFNELSKLKKWLHWVVTFNVKKLWEAFNDYIKYSPLKKPSNLQERNIFYTGKHLRQIMARYHWEPQQIEIILIRSSQNDADQYKNYHVLNWQKLAKGGLAIKTAEGDHVGIFEGEAAKNLASIVDEMIDKYGH